MKACVDTKYVCRSILHHNQHHPVLMNSVCVCVCVCVCVPCQKVKLGDWQ